jgi:hypothetical protein
VTILAEQFADDITLTYSLIDRMRVRGHVMNFQNVRMLGAFFQRFRGVDWIERRGLHKLTTNFVQSIEMLAQRNNIPLLSAKPGEGHVDQAAPFLDGVADRDDGIYSIIKVQE